MNQEIPQSAQKVLKVYRFNKDNFATADKNSERAMRYVLNKQWTSDEINAANAANKPHLTYNLLLSTINILEGNEETTRRRPRFKSDIKKFDQATAIVQGRWNALNDEQNIEENLQVAFIDSLIKCKGGWIERRIEMNEEGYLDFNYSVADGMMIYPDPEWKPYDTKMENCRNVIKETWETLDTIKDRYDPRIADNKPKREWWQSLSETIRRYTQKYFSGSVFGYDKVNDRYLVIEMQERTKKRVFTVFDAASGNYHYIDPPDWKKLSAQNPSLKKIRNDEKETIHITTIIPYFDNKTVVDDDSKYPYKGHPKYDVFPVFSYRLNAQADEMVSLIDALLDLQDDYNKGKSQLRDYATQGVSGPTIWSNRDKEAMEEVQRKGNGPNVHIAVRDTEHGRPYKLQPDRIQPEVLMSNSDSIALLKELSQTPAATRAITERSGESAALFREKLSAAGNAVNPYYKNLSILRKNLAEDFLDLFGYVYAENDRIVRLKNAENQTEYEIVNLEMAGQVFNDTSNPSMVVELDEGEDNMTQREENWNKMFAIWQQVIQVNPQKADVIMDELIAMAPVNGIDKIVTSLENLKQQQAGTGQQAAQLEEQKIQSEIDKNISDAELNRAKAQTQGRQGVA